MKRKGKWIAALIAVCLSFTFLAACGGGKYAIELNRNSASVYVGEELTLTAKVTLGGEETAAAVSWTSSDPSVATVENGKVKALKAGKTTVAATAEKVSAACEVTVLEPSFTISLDKSELPLFVGESETLNVTASDGNAYDYGWSSSNEAVATVDGGNVTAVAEGTATITVSCYNLTAACSVVVSEEDVFLILSNDKAEIKVGGTLKLTASLTDGSSAEIAWSSSDESVATVEDGAVTALKAGRAVITAAAGEGLSDTCTVTVADDYTLIFPELPENVFVGQELDLGVIVRKNGVEEDVSEAQITGEGFTAAAGKITPEKSGEISVTVSYHGQTRTQTVAVYHEVKMAEDLKAVNNDLSGWYMMTADIDFKGGYAETIAHYSDGHSAKNSGFLGVFDGNGHSVMNFTPVYKGAVAANSSLFGWIGDTGVVRNLNALNVSIESRIAGGLANTNYGLIENCFAEATVHYFSASDFNNPIGGICSKNYGNIKNTVAALSVGAEGGETSCIGGFVGRHLSGSSMTNCYALSELGFTEAATPTNGSMAGTLTACGSYAALAELYENMNKTAFSALWSFDEAAYPHLGTIPEDITVLNENFEIYAGAVFSAETTSVLPVRFALAEETDGVSLSGGEISVGESVAAGTQIKVRVYSLYNAGAAKEFTLTVLENNVEVTAETTVAEFTVVKGEEGEWSKDLGIVVKINGEPVEEGFEIRSTDPEVAAVEGGTVTCVGDGTAKVEVVVNGTVMLTIEVVCNVYNPVRTAQDFDDIRKAQNAKYILMNDIDFEGRTFPAFSCWATAVSTSKTAQFTGVFDGNGYSLLNINPGQEAGSGSSDWSIFGVIGKTGVVRNLSVIGANIDNRAGVISSYLAGRIENCYVEVTVRSTANTNLNNPVGGIAEKSVAGALVKDCVAVVTVAEGAGETFIGGVVGQSKGDIENSQLINVNGSLGVHDGSENSTGKVTQSAAYAGLDAFYHGETGADLSAYGKIWVFTEGYLPHLDKMSDSLLIEAGENVYQGTVAEIEVICAFGAVLSLKNPVDGVTLENGALTVSADAAAGTEIVLVARSLYLPSATAEKTLTVRENEFTVEIGTESYEFTWIAGADEEGNPYAAPEDYSAAPVFTVMQGGQPYEGEITLASSDETAVKISDGRIVATGDGSAVITIAVGDNVLGEIAVVSAMYNPVRTTEEFLAIGKDNASMAKKYVLMNDLDFGGARVHAFSSYKTSSSITFTGIFDGNGYTISNIEPYANILNSSDRDRAIFGYMDKGAIVRNVSFVGVKAADRFSVVSNWCENGLIENVYIEVNYGNYEGFTGNANSGNPTGMVAAKLRANGVVRNCVVKLTVEEGAYSAFAGGIVGQNQGKVENSALIYAARGEETVNPVYQNTSGGTSTAAAYADTDAFFAADLSSFDLNVWTFDAETKAISLKKNCFKG